MGTVRAEPDDACPQIGSANNHSGNKTTTIGGLPELTMSSQWEVTFEDESCKILIFDRETPPGTTPKNWAKMAKKVQLSHPEWVHFAILVVIRGQVCPKSPSLRGVPSWPVQEWRGSRNEPILRKTVGSPSQPKSFPA